jgi:hypothetical protein
VETRAVVRRQLAHALVAACPTGSRESGYTARVDLPSRDDGQYAYESMLQEFAPPGYPMRTSLILLAALLALAAPWPSPAGPPKFTGNDLARLAALFERSRQQGRFLNEQEERQVNYFIGYVEGAALGSRDVCLPSTPGVREQLCTATASYLREHPSEWRLAPEILVVKAVEPVFPCAKKRPRKP